jgi:2-polyprenyl-6-methoxyphenol hydroxylase-like FAD-dependent oxidoreductase
MVGMAVARALSEAFREVVVIERDNLPKDAPEHRRGVPQSWHIHHLMLRGQRELEELFPGFGDEAVRLGAVQIDYGREVARCTDVGFCPLIDTGYLALSATRALIEFAERQRFRALCTNAVVIENTRVTALLTEGSASKLRAVGVRTDHPEHGEIRADLVVDCSGRSMLWKGWFKERGVPLPRETVVDSRCGYATRLYRLKEGQQRALKGMSVDPLFPGRPQWGVMAPIEHDQWVVTIGGFNEQYPPSDDAGFTAFGKRLQTPLFSAWLDEAEPVTPVRTFRRLEMRWNHFERYEHPIRNFMAVGDSAWAYNPLYGQGMSIGVTCARILRDVVRKDADLKTLPRRYYRAAKKFAYLPWYSGALLDFAWPKTLGKKPWYTELSRLLGHTVLRAAQFEDDVFLAFLEGAHLLREPHQVFTPRVLFGLCRYTLRKLTASLPPTDLQRLPSSTGVGALDTGRGA